MTLSIAQEAPRKILHSLPLRSAHAGFTAYTESVRGVAMESN